MTNISVDLLTLAKKLDNYEIDPVTGLKVKWINTSLFKVTVPAGKRWFFMGGHCKRDVASILTIYVKDPSGNIILNPAYYASGTTVAPFPIDAYSGNNIFPYVMDVGDSVNLIFDTAQTAAAYASVHVLEIDV